MSARVRALAAQQAAGRGDAPQQDEAARQPGGGVAVPCRRGSVTTVAGDHGEAEARGVGNRGCDAGRSTETRRLSCRASRASAGEQRRRRQRDGEALQYGPSAEQVVGWDDGDAARPGHRQRRRRLEER